MPVRTSNSFNPSLARTFQAVGIILVLRGAPLLAPLPARAANRTSRVATAVPRATTSQSTVCTQEGCSPETGEKQPSDADRKLGTKITWMQSPDEAMRAASDETKLVFMIQVSGNFARQEFT